MTLDCLTLDLELKFIFLENSKSLNLIYFIAFNWNCGAIAHEILERKIFV
jgi:hypothetical protein